MATDGPANVVFGAAGATGLEVVKRLLEKESLPTRAVCRDPAKLAGVLEPSPKLQVVKGDVTDPASLKEALKGARGVVFAASGRGYWSASEVDFQGVANVAAAAKEAGAGRVVLVSSMLVTKKNWLNPVRLLLNNIRWGLMDNKLKGEDALRASGVDYTIVRPGGLGRQPGGQATLVTGQGDCMSAGGQIQRADVAAVVVEALGNPGASRVTLELVSRPGAPEGGFDAQLKGMWAGLKPDATA
ncbi:hypothetical protein HYH03_001477 [Edaphochlamys debaryana]|uniref:NAD(P)-binding domain-containing protein n=1 Tax=Edaphochlamys debaryana TaxID=47281 RepID=A0A836C6H4_9CHLO|nr:hypothetical protein HYH03_001477 [Edaphochlamys debaryana]|eukprot:KAG2500712.1 hypothetical protein HYH03_001477 [Edaphochlamys debaryana]